MMAANSCVLGVFICLVALCFGHLERRQVPPFTLWGSARHGIPQRSDAVSKFVLLIAGTYLGVGNVNLMGWILVHILTSFITVPQRFSRPQATCCHTLIA
jgi:hypothetical protein